MDDQVDLTEEEIDRLIAEVSGDDDVADGDDFDVVSEMEELYAASGSTSTDSVKGITAELKEGDTVGVKKIEDDGKISKEDKQIAEKLKTKEEKHKTEATGAVSVPTEIMDKPFDEAKKKKDEIAVKENVAIATEKKMSASLEKDKKEMSVAAKDDDLVTTGKEKCTDQHGKRADNKKNEGKKVKSNEETLRGAKKSGAGGENKGSPGKGMTGGERGTGVPPTTSGKAVTKIEKGTKPATVGKAAGGKDAGTGGGSTREEKSPSGDKGKGERVASLSVSSVCPDAAAASSVEEEICDRAVVRAESFPIPVQSACDDGKERVQPTTGLSSDTVESVPGKVEELVGSMSSTASSAGDLGTMSKKETEEKPIAEKMDTNSKDTDSGPKSSQENESLVPLLTSDELNAQMDSSAKLEMRSSEARSIAATGSIGGEVGDTEAELAGESSDQKKKSDFKSKEQNKGQSSQTQSWFSGWGLSTITGAGKKAISSGIGVLENIGRKTMSVLTEEPESDGVAPLSPSASPPSQSSSLRRKKKSDPKTSETSKAQMLRKCFDDCQGLAHFDALTDLSQVSQEKLTKQLERLSGDRLSAVKTDLALIKDASDLGGMDWEEDFGSTDHDFCQLTKDFLSQLSLSSTNVQKLFGVQETTSKWLSSCLQENPQDQKYSAEDIHKMAILMFADFTATGIATFHKIAQLLLVDYSAPILSYKFRALSLAGLTKVFCTEIWIEARKFTDCLTQPQLTEKSGMVVSLMTNLTLEASNCSSCIQDGYHLLLPIVQLASLKVHPIVSDCSEIANLEILQLMSSVSRSRVGRILNQLSSDTRHEVQTELSAVEAAFHLSLLSRENDADKPCHDFKAIVTDCLSKAGVDINSQKLLRVQEQTRNWLLSCEKDQENSTPISPSDVNQMALKSLNELMLCSIELFHQVGQILLMENPREISTYGPRASAIRNLTKLLSSEVECQSTMFADCILRISKQNEETMGSELQMQESSSSVVAPMVTNIYLEASNSSTYIEDGFQLLLPIIQLALIKAHPATAGLEG